MNLDELITALQKLRENGVPGTTLVTTDNDDWYFPIYDIVECYEGYVHYLNGVGDIKVSHFICLE